jgi:hypothetical protein
MKLKSGDNAVKLIAQGTEFEMLKVLFLAEFLL